MTRQAFVDWAIGQIGPDTRERRLRYFRSAIGREPTEDELRKAWCGIFALCGLHEVDLAKDVFWRFGKGFLLQPPHPLPVTRSPLPGDIGYQGQPFQHHFVVESVDGTLIHSVDGNQPEVARRTRSFGPALTFYSIAPLLAPTEHHSSPAELQHALNTLASGFAHYPYPMLTVDGIIGPKSVAAIKWAQGVLGVPVTGTADAATLAGLKLS